MPAKHLFVVGAQRSGTTFLYRMLDAHPQIEMAKPERPEPKYFIRSDFADLSREDYLNTYFANASAPVRGEKSTSYLEYAEAAARIVAWFPEAHILVMLRNPIDRAVSNYKFTKKHGLESLDVDTAFRTEDERREDYDHSKISASPYAYLQRGHYINYLGAYEQHFSPAQMHYLIFERLTTQLPYVQRLYQRLGVDATFAPPLFDEAVNSADEPAAALGPDLIAYLKDHFRPSVEQLRTHMGDPIPEWEI